MHPWILRNCERRFIDLGSCFFFFLGNNERTKSINWATGTLFVNQESKPNVFVKTINFLTKKLHVERFNLQHNVEKQSCERSHFAKHVRLRETTGTSLPIVHIFRVMVC